MSFQRFAALVVAAVLGVGLAAPATAGTGAASWCGDAPPPGVEKIPVVNDPVLGYLVIEYRIGPPVTGVAVCFSDRQNGVPSVVYGGFAEVYVTSAGEVRAWCAEDPSAVVTCNGTTTLFRVLPGGGDQPTTRQSTTCAVYALGSCQLFVTTVSAEVFAGAAPTTVTVLNIPVIVDPGEICIGLAGCP